MSIAVTTLTPSLESEAHALAKQLHLPYTLDTHGYDFAIMVTPDHFELIKQGTKLLPLYVDFLSKKITYRRRKATLRNELLARALGLKAKTQPKILDATAGLARDSFIIASLGFEVQSLERSPVIHALVEDGIQRALSDPEVAPIISRLHLIQADAITWLQNCKEPPDIIYLDPMFPERQKSASVKKEMLIFQEIIDADDDTEILLKTALACASKRVVVKRPRLAEPIKGVEPSFSLKGSSSRFDIYLK